ncbi:MAG: 1,4-beta-xylanase [Caulobacter sp.]|nr:1,4-beta-xylanase [Caulobacter sp.]
MIQRPTRRAAIGGGLFLAACSRAADEAAAAPIVDVPLKSLAGFPVGCAVMTGHLTEPAFATLLTRHFSQITPEWEMKMEYICGDDGALRFEAPDALAAFARAQHLRLHGHTLVWYANIPKAFAELDVRRASFAEAYRNYIANVVTRYRDVAPGWDVVNEPIEDNDSGSLRQSLWSARLGDTDHIRRALDHAREADPKAVLFINDYNLELNPKKRTAFLRLAETLLKAGAPLGGLGTQTHLAADLSAGAVAGCIKDLASLGLALHVSEMDVSVAWAKGLPRRAAETRQAELYAEAMGAFMALPARQRYAFTLWGLRDPDSWHRRDKPKDAPLLFDDAGAPKPAFAAVAEALRKIG